MSIITLTAIRSAEENRQVIVNGQKSSAKAFIEMAIAMFQIKEHKQYKAMGYEKIADFLDAQDINMSRSQYFDMANLGEALRWINTSEDELVLCGYSSCKEIARLATDYKSAERFKLVIAELITKRSKGLIDNAKVRDRVKAELEMAKPASKSNPPAPAPAPAPEAEPEEAEEEAVTVGDWRTKYRAMIGKASDEADFIAMMRELLG